MSPLLCGMFRIGPLLIRYGTEEVYFRLGNAEVIYDLSILVSAVPVVTGGLALLACVGWWQLRKSGQ